MSPTPAPPSVDRDAVLFDLDGTLVDHFSTLYQCYKYTLEQLNLPIPSPTTVRRAVGGSVEVTMRHFVDETRCADALRLWRRRLDEIYLDDVSLMAGAGELLRVLRDRGVRLGVFTNKPGRIARGIVEHLRIANCFTVVLGANDTPHRKPQPEFTRAILEQLGALPDRTVLIGDSPFDIEAAHAVGMRCACVATGTHTAEELQAAGADAVYPDLPALGAGEFGA